MVAATRRGWLRAGIATFAATVLLSGVAWGQLERLELGKRLQRFELAWEQAPAEVRVASTPLMQQAVSSFFSLRLRQAAEKLDQAWWLTTQQRPDPWEQAVSAHRIVLDSLVVSTSQDQLLVRLEPFYQAGQGPAAEAEVRFRIVAAPKVRAAQLPVAAEEPEWTAVSRWSEATAGVPLPLASLPQGDYWVQAQVVEEARQFDCLPAGWSRIERVEQRLQALRDFTADRQSPWPDWLRETVVDHSRLLTRLIQGDVQEIDYPAHQILRFCEDLMADPAEGATLCRQTAQRQDLWMTVAQGRRKVALRIRSPEIKEGDRLPVLVLFHGAGGSENMFFETYGAGGAVQAGLERGWLVVAVRQSLTGMSLDVAQILEHLEEIYPIDRSRLFLLGHSMGAGQVATQVGRHPDLPVAVAAIGGGGRPRNLEAAAQVPWFIAAGALDFGRGGAVGLSRSLQRAGGTQVVYREYPDVEHLVIVQAALTAAFEFFDAAAEAGKPELSP